MGHHEENSCFSEIFLSEIDSAINFDLPPVFDDYAEPLLHKDWVYAVSNVGSYIKLNRPPKFDDYGVEETVLADSKTPCYSPDCGVRFGLLDDGDECSLTFGLSKGIVDPFELKENTISAKEFHICPNYYLAYIQVLRNEFGPSTFRGGCLGDLQAKIDAAMFGNLACSQDQVVNHGEEPVCSWCKFQTKRSWELNMMDEVIVCVEDDELKDGSSSLLMLNIDLTSKYLQLVFDPGILRLVSGFDAACYSREDGSKFVLIAAPSRCIFDPLNLQNQAGYYLVVFQANVAATLGKSCYFHCLFVNKFEFVVKPSGHAASMTGSSCSRRLLNFKFKEPCSLFDCVHKFGLQYKLSKSNGDPLEFQDHKDSFEYVYGFKLFSKPNQRMLALFELQGQSRYSLFAIQMKSCAATVQRYAWSFFLIVNKDQGGSYLVGFHTEKGAATLEVLSCMQRLLNQETRDQLRILVHGGRWGGWHKQIWHKGILKQREINKQKIGNEDGVGMYSRWLLGIVIIIALLLALFVFDPGGLKLQELRTILF